MVRARRGAQRRRRPHQSHKFGARGRDRSDMILTGCYDVSYSDPPLGASYFSCETSAISAGRQRLSEGHRALPGPPDGAGLLPMDPAEVPNQLDPRRRVARDHQPAFQRGRARCVEKADTLRSISGILSF